MRDAKEEVKHRLGIVEVISAYVKLQKAGTNYKALCPFHNEKTPSFTVSPDKDMWYCFGCGEGGDLFSFIQRIEGIEFIDALKMLAERAGVELRPEDRKISSRRNKLLDIVELSTKFFEKQRESSVGKKTVAYLKKRGLTDATIASWRLGYAPDNWDSLYAFLTSKGFTNEDVEQAGLTIKSEQKAPGRGYHDRFRHRIMFPIFNVQGQVVGFSGRLFPASPAGGEDVAGKTTGKNPGKYINTPNTPLYDKSRVLYGLDRAKMALKHKDVCVLVEGNLDVILAHQAGTEHALAPCGTAVGQDHFALIRRYTENVALCFDSDSAGIKATKKSAHTAMRAGLNVSVIALPHGKDAADVISEDVSVWTQALETPVSFITFVMNVAGDAHDLTQAQGKKEYAREVLSTIRSVASPVEQEHWVHHLAGETGMSEEALREEMAGLPEEMAEPEEHKQRESVPASPHNEEDAPQAVEEYLAVLAIKDPNTLKKLWKEEYGVFFESERIRATVLKLSQGVDPAEAASADTSLQPLLFAAELLETLIEPEEVPKEMERVLFSLRRRHVRHTLHTLQQDLQRAEGAKDTPRVQELLKKFSELSQKLTEYERQKENV